MKRTSLLFVLLAAASAVRAAAPEGGTWRFAVSGDSRNCGDVVMPAIARGAKKDGAAFYWHLGDFRAIYDFDQDMRAAHGGAMLISQYQSQAWDDFIANQLTPFGSMPVRLGIGNHELIAPMTRAGYVSQFADWLDEPVLRDQRLADDPADRRLKTYYHWKQGGADFVNLDNASEEQFDGAQVAWFERVLARAKADPEVRLLVVGLHESLPNSFSCGHGMNDSAAGTESGRKVYRDLLKWTRETGKSVQVLSSHSHYVMEGLYATPYWKNAKAGDRGVLPGWLVGTAGATRYGLPPGLPAGMFAKTGVYGYLLATVAKDGGVAFEYKEVRRGDVPEDVVSRFGRATVDECFKGNRDAGFSAGAPSCSDQ
ncbi:MAG: hypothetical protein ACHQ51_13240 [Elusimicrobiota bacterium]